MEKPEQKSPDIEELLMELSTKVERVKVLYEQYFMGIEKMEPQVARKEVQRALLLLQQQYIRNAGLRFKFNALLQKWNIYITYWNRVLREIESGTYTRHLAKAARAAAREGKALPEELLRGKHRPATPDTKPADNSFVDLDSDVLPAIPKRDIEADGFDLETVPVTRSRVTPLPQALPPAAPRQGPPPIPGRAAAPPPPPPPRPPAPPSPSPVPGLSENDLRALHQKYVAARKQVGENPNVSYDTLVKSLARQVPTVMSQPGVKAVRFDVSVQNGKAVLKAIPQKK